VKVLILVSSICLTASMASALAQAPVAAQPQRAPTPRAAAEQPTPAPAPAQAPAPAPRREGQPINVKVDVTITDQRGGAAPIKRSVSVVVGDGFTGLIRSQSEVFGVGSVPLNIDAEPTLLSDGKVRVRFNLQYDWPAPYEAGANLPRGSVIKTALHDTVALILENGKPMVVAQSADPIGDRQVSVEIKASILR
jgi:hypothetical protein